MLNKIWFWMLVIGILYGFGKGAWNSWEGRSSADAPAATATPQPSTASPDKAPQDRRNLREMGQALNAATIDSAKTSVEICIGLIGIMALWLGLLKIAEDSGMVAALAGLLRPLMRWLFPDVPDGHAAQGAMLMNLSANMLGLDNAATPLGLKAMEELQTLNPHKDTASNAMAMFLAINTSSLTIIPFTIIGYRVLKGSADPAGPLAAMILTTSVTVTVAVTITKLLSKSKRYALPDTLSEGAESEDQS
jgi:spore maturation protein A